MSIKDDIRILLVKDNSNDAELTFRAFKKRNLANVIDWVKDGAEALNYIAARSSSSPPLLILLDLKLPRISGLEVLKELKSNPKTKTIPVVVLTSSREQKDLIESYQLGVNSYIVKPVDFDQFASSVADLGYYWLVLNQLP